jgi:hypothetical protein
MNRSLLAPGRGEAMDHPGSQSSLFGAPLDADGGTSQDRIDADLVILPGGLMLVEQSSPLAKEHYFECKSGDFHCNNGRD